MIILLLVVSGVQQQAGSLKCCNAFIPSPTLWLITMLCFLSVLIHLPINVRKPLRVKSSGIGIGLGTMQSID